MEKICFLKCGEDFQYELEYESIFSNGSASLAEGLSSNMKIELAGHPKIVPDPISVIFSYWVFHKLQRIERGPKAGGEVYRGELYRHHANY